MIHKKSDFAVDVIVVGYGAAGGSAAIIAHEYGADVLILDKMEQPGGNSLVSSAMMIYPQTLADVEKLRNYLCDVCHDVVEPELIAAFVTGLMENEAWFNSMGGELEVYDYKTQDPSYSYYIPDKTFFHLPSAQDLNLVLKHLKQTEIVPQPTGGNRVWHLLNREVERRQIKVLTSTPVKKLVKDEAGEITGVIAQSNGGDIYIEARKGVILTCGGFEYNEALKWDNLRPQPIHALGNPSNTGDGIKLVQDVGAALWHMSAQASTFGFRPPDWKAGFALTMRHPGFIYIDHNGYRFMDETRLEAHNASFATDRFDLRTFEYSYLPSYLIMDEENARGKPVAMNIFSYNVVVKGYIWSEDNSEEINKGWIIKADTLAELSSKLNVNEDILRATITTYNQFCSNGVDVDYGRSSDSLKIIDPPYYAMRLEPLLYNTQGGPRRDQNARVLNPEGQPILRLYAAGEFGSIWGFRYQTSTNFSEALIYGRIAGKNAAMLPPYGASSH